MKEEELKKTQIEYRNGGRAQKKEGQRRTELRGKGKQKWDSAGE